MNMTEIIGNYEDIVEDTQKDRYLTFLIGSESYGIEVRYVTEITGMQAITDIPELPDYIRGIINLRGQIIPVMDVRLRFKKVFREYTDRTCIIIVDISNMPIGLIVDAVSEVITIPEEDVVDPPQTNTNIYNRYIRKIGKVGNEVKLLLDCGKLLGSDDLDSLNSAL